LAGPVTLEERRAFIARHTSVTSPPLVPELRLHLATDVTQLWQSSEQLFQQTGLPPPFWAFCWPGGQALARYVLDAPERVRAKRVLDFAAGGGVSAIAAVRAGAAAVTASEIDVLALDALGLNAELNDVTFDTTDSDLVGRDEGWDVVFAGDVCYERPVAERITSWLRQLSTRGALVLMGDPGRTYQPRDRIEPVARYVVPTSRDLEDREQRETSVLRILP
jgi:predicted nicotinamide N-methyase